MSLSVHRIRLFKTSNLYEKPVQLARAYFRNYPVSCCLPRRWHGRSTLIKFSIMCAKIKYSALVSDMRNKLNGSVLSKNRYGAYVRNKVTPVNPQSSFQQAVRQRLAAFSSQYRGITQAQRMSWINGAINFPFTDIFGDIKHLSGQTLFVKLNTNLDLAGQPSIQAAPMPVGIPELAVTAVESTLAAGEITALDLTVSAAVVPAGFALAIYATPPTSPSIQFVKNRYRFIGTASAVGGEVDVLALYSARFGTAASAGEQIHVRVALISTTTGQQGVPSAASGVL